jgi:hypothetical protein
MDSALLCHRLGMDRTALSPLLRSFERHLRAANRSERTIASYLESLRQVEAFLAARGKGLTEAGRADLEAFLAELLTRRAAGSAPCRSAEGRPSRSTATCASGPAAGTPRCRGCGWAARGG